jgi:hypothetical protein
MSVVPPSSLPPELSRKLVCTLLYDRPAHIQGRTGLLRSTGLGLTIAFGSFGPKAIVLRSASAGGFASLLSAIPLPFLGQAGVVLTYPRRYHRPLGLV